MWIEIAETALLIPLTVIPALVSLRWTLLGGVLFLLNAIVSVLLIVYDPFDAFPYRDVAGGRDRWIAAGMDAAVEDEADLIVVGSHGRAGIERLLIGSVARKVVTHARYSVLVVRRMVVKA